MGELTIRREIIKAGEKEGHVYHDEDSDHQRDLKAERSALKEALPTAVEHVGHQQGKQD